MSDNLVDLSDVQKIGRLSMNQIYYIYDRGSEQFGFSKYMSLFSPKEKMTQEGFLFAVKFLGDDKFIKIDSNG